MIESAKILKIFLVHLKHFWLESCGTFQKTAGTFQKFLEDFGVFYRILSKSFWNIQETLETYQKCLDQCRKVLQNSRTLKKKSFQVIGKFCNILEIQKIQLEYSGAFGKIREKKQYHLNPGIFLFLIIINYYRLQFFSRFSPRYFYHRNHKISMAELYNIDITTTCVHSLPHSNSCPAPAPHPAPRQVILSTPIT